MSIVSESVGADPTPTRCAICGRETPFRNAIDSRPICNGCYVEALDIRPRPIRAGHPIPAGVFHRPAPRGVIR